MKEIVKEHPLRPIILRFDLKKKPLDFEQKALEAYYRMHDKSWAAKQNLQQHRDALRAIEARATELELDLATIERHLAFIEVTFKLTDNTKLPEVHESFSLDIVDFYEEVENHNKALIELHRRVIAESDWFDEWLEQVYEREDWFDAQDDEGSDLIHRVFRHYDDVSVDIISLDRDQQEFFGVLGEIRKLQENYFDYGESVIEYYNRLHFASEDAYQRALHIHKYVNENFPLNAAQAGNMPPHRGGNR